MVDRSQHGVVHHCVLVVRLDVTSFGKCKILFVLGEVLVAFDIDPF